MKPKIYLIDGNAYVHRAYHALPPLTTSKGVMVNAVYGFLRMVLKLKKSENPEYLAVCFDYPAPTFRHDSYPLYKATRKQIDEELKLQMPLCREAVKVLGISSVEVKGFEADDVIATLAHQAEKMGAEVVIVTSDKDASQLVDGNISIWNEAKGTLLDAGEVTKRYGLSPGQLTDMFALMGDSSDNVPGIKGIGEKTAVKLIQEFGTLEHLLESTQQLEGKVKERIENGKAEARRSKELVTLCDTVPLEIRWNECTLQKVDEEKLKEFLCRYEFTSLLEELIPEKDPSEACGKNVELDIAVNIIYLIEELQELTKKIIAQGHVSIDLETTSVKPSEAQIVGISLAVDTHNGYYIPVGHTCPDAPQQLEADMVLSTLKSILEDPDIKKYGQNIKYDALVLKNAGINLQGIYFDTMVASYCLNPSRLSHNLKSLALDFLGLQMTPIEALIGKGAKQTTMDTVAIETVSRYACADAVIVMRLAAHFTPQIKEKKLEKLFYELEMPLVPVLTDMEFEGIKVNRAYLNELSDSFSEAIRKIEKEVFVLAGKEFNLNSPKQLSVILFETLKLPVIRRTKTGLCTDEEVLRTLAHQHALPAKLIEYRELQKLRSTYIDALVRLSNEGTGRVHTSFNQAVTATGRLSSSDPNLQNIPIRSEYGKQIRKAFIADKKKLLLSADYSQIDLRVLAHISGDEVLIDAFTKGEDIHSATARDIFGCGPGKVSEEERRIAKTINFGIIYGMSAYGLAAQLGIAPTEAKEFIDRYFNRYQGVKQWLGDIVAKARRDGFVTTLLGRIRYLPEMHSKNGQLRAFAERTATNTPIQGTSADIIKVAMIHIHELFEKQKLQTKMLVQVHDDLLFEMPETEREVVPKLVKSSMENALRLKIPIVVDMKSGSNWSEMKPLEVQRA